MFQKTKHSSKKIEAIDKGRSIRLIPYFSDLFNFFFTLYKLTWDVASSFPFSLKGERKRFLFYNQSFFVVSPIKSIPQVFTGSFAVDFRDHLRSRIIWGPFWGSFAVSGSFAAGDHLRYCTLLPFFGTRLRRQNFNLAPTQYRNLRRLALYVPPMPGGNLFLPALYSGIACESHIKKDTRKNITKNIARKDHR